MIRFADARPSRTQSFAPRLALLICLLCAALPLCGQSAPAPQPAAASTLRINSGDLLELAVFDTPEFSGKLRVSESGDVLIPVAGSVHLAGLTAQQAAGTIESRFRELDVLKDPHVTIFILEYATQGVTISGEVRAPGIYPLLGNHNLMDLIAAAGGATNNAGHVVVITHRDSKVEPEFAQFDPKSGLVKSDVDIRPGDMISLARSGVVYIIGDVNRPGGYLIENNGHLTVLQALALAQGSNRTAALKHTHLIRKTDVGREEYALDLKLMLQNRVPDWTLNDGDILYVPSSQSKYLTYRGIEAAVQVVSGIAIYKAY